MYVPTRAEKARAKRAAETPEQRETRLAKRRARYANAEWREKHRADCRAYYAANKEQQAEYGRQHRAKPESKARELVRARRRHGIANPTAETRSGMCSVAGCTYEGPLVLDHWHSGPKEGEVRGWVCNSCNLAMGLLQDDPAKLRAVADYIELAAGIGWPPDP
jgi:hypothetical protein